MSDALRRTARETLIVGLRNAHAMERQAVSVLEPQLRQLKAYPELHARVASHVDESRVQAMRLEAALRRCDATPSAFKDTVLSVMGLGHASVQGLADDAVIKAMLADIMFEHFEIASYRSMLELAGLAEMDDLRPDLETSLREEEAMAAWLEDNLAAVTRRYVELAAGLDDRAAAAPAAVLIPAAATPPAVAPGAPPPGAAPASPADEGPEAPLRDLEEFTDADAEPDAWPSGDEKAPDRPREEQPTGA